MDKDKLIRLGKCLAELPDEVAQIGDLPTWSDGGWIPEGSTWAG